MSLLPVLCFLCRNLRLNRIENVFTYLKYLPDVFIPRRVTVKANVSDSPAPYSGPSDIKSASLFTIVGIPAAGYMIRQEHSGECVA